MLLSSSSSAAQLVSPLQENDNSNSSDKSKKKKGKKDKPSLGQAVNDPFVRSFYSMQEYEKYRRDLEQVGEIWGGGLVI